MSKYVKMRDGTAVIAVTGRFDLCVIPILEGELLPAYTNGCTKVEVDFSETTYIESAAVGVLVKIKVKVGGDNFAIKNLKGAVLKNFQEMNLFQIFQGVKAD